MKEKISRYEQLKSEAGVRILCLWHGREEEGLTWNQLLEGSSFSKASLSKRLLMLMEENYLKKQGCVVNPGKPNHRVIDQWFLKRPELGTAYEISGKTVVVPRERSPRIFPAKRNAPDFVDCGVLRRSGKPASNYEKKGSAGSSRPKGFRRIARVKIVPGQTVEELRPPSSSFEECAEESRRRDSKSALNALPEGSSEQWFKELREASRGKRTRQSRSC